MDEEVGGDRGLIRSSGGGEVANRGSADGLES